MQCSTNDVLDFVDRRRITGTQSVASRKALTDPGEIGGRNLWAAASRQTLKHQ
jgi:hypothetical protein